MKSVCRRMLALLLVLAMCFSLAVTAWAAEESSAPETSVSTQEEPAESVEEAEASQAAVQPEEAEAAPEESEGVPEESDADSDEVSQQEAPEDQQEAGTPEESGLPGLSTADESTNAEDDKDLIEAKEAFVRVDKNKNISLKAQPTAPAYFVSKNESVLTAQKELSAGGKLVVHGVSVGKAVVEMHRTADDTLLDSLVVYVYRPSTTSRASGTNTRANPADLTTTNSDGLSRTYKLVCQQKHSPGNRPFKNYLSAHGCTICASSAVCQAMGATEMTVDWMTGGGLEEIAVRSGWNIEDHTMGYYGMQQVLEYAGISSKIYNWKNNSASNVEKAKEELVKNLSAGRPVLIFIDQKSKWNGIGPLCAAMHCIVLTGIDDSGNLQIINSSYPHKISRFKYGGSEHTVKLTPGELLDHFVRHSSTGRSKEDDFYFSKAGGLHTMLLVTCDKATVPQRSSITGEAASLSQTSYTYTGEAFTPQVTVGNLTENKDFTVLYSDNVNAGTATATIAGLGDRCGLKKLSFTIARAPGKITASDKVIASSDEEQTVSLGASAKGDAKLGYSSDNEAVKVDSSGVATVSAGFAGTVKVTIKSAKTTNYNSAKKTITLTVSGEAEDQRSAGKVTASGKTVTSKGKAQTVKLKASAKGGAKLSYSSDVSKVEVSSSGKVSVPKNYVGVVKITIKAAATDKYKSASKTVKVKVVPSKVSLSGVQSKKKGEVQVTWKKGKSISGYEIGYWSSKDSGGKVRTVKVNSKTTSRYLKKLKSKAKYKIRIRSFKNSSDTTLYSAWSSTKSVKVK